RAMSNWTPPDQRGFAQGITHSFARFGNAISPPLVVALMAGFGWRGSFVALGLASIIWVVIWGIYFRDDPRTHAAVTSAETERLPPYRGRREQVAIPWGPLIRRMTPVVIVY